MTQATENKPLVVGDVIEMITDAGPRGKKTTGYAQKGDILKVICLGTYPMGTLVQRGGSDYASGVGYYFDPSASWRYVEDAKALDAKFKCALELVSFTKNALGVSTGADPEVFVLDGKGKVIPAWKFLPPQKTPSGIVNTRFWDGFQAEFTFAESGCHSWVGDRVQAALKDILSAARKVDPTAQLTYKSVVPVLHSTLSRAKKEYVQFGCAPSLNVYDTEHFEIPDGREVPIRFAGCHLHFGINSFYAPKGGVVSFIPYAVRALDRVIGPLMTALLSGLEDERRRRYYGRAGEYRTPEHGMEWRVPSSTILCHPAVFFLIIDTARFTLGVAKKEGTLDTLCPVEGGDARIQDIVNNLNVDEARKLIKENEHYYQGMLDRIYSETVPRKEIFNAILEGVTNHLSVGSMSDNWRLNDHWTSHSESPGCNVSHGDWH